MIETRSTQRRRLTLRSAALLLLVILTAAASNVAAAGASQAYPGHLIEVGGQYLHLFCEGEGSPTVILDAGLGGVSAEWYPLQGQLAEVTQTCSYDRAGSGWSTPARGPRTSIYLAAELYALLKRSGLAGPYVFVGHSFGGVIAQMFAHRYTHETAGLVLLDASHPEQVRRFLEPPIGLNTAPSRRGIVRYSAPRLPVNLAPEVEVLVRRLMAQPKARAAMAEEYFGFRESLRRLAQEGPLPDVPVMVLSHGARIWPDTPKGDLIERLWAELQADLIRGVPRAAHLVASESGHHIHLDQPNLVWDAVATLVRLHRKATDDATLVSGREWFAFEHAIWMSDTLHTAQYNVVRFDDHDERVQN
jgi:pimeloyl-ACP methyl ester carboxylesterase